MAMRLLLVQVSLLVLALVSPAGGLAQAGALPSPEGPALLERAGLTRGEIAALDPGMAEWLVADLAAGSITPVQAQRFVASLGRALPAVESDRLLRGAAPRRSSRSVFRADPSAPCKQAWNGPGSGAWYRVDTACQSSQWSATSMEIGFGSVVYGPGREGVDGVYQSLGLYNTETGAGADIGFTHVKDAADGRHKWATYGNDMTARKDGRIFVDPTRHPRVDLRIDIPAKGSLRLTVRDHSTGELIGQESMTGWDPKLGIDPSGAKIGWYRFDSIAQPKEDFKSGTSLKNAVSQNWRLYHGKGWTLAKPSLIASSVYGYSPGRCCSEAEKERITVTGERQWYASTVTITY